MKVRSRAGSGVSTPGGGVFKSLSERDLQKADAALKEVNVTVATAEPETASATAEVAAQKA